MSNTYKRDNVAFRAQMAALADARKFALYPDLRPYGRPSEHYDDTLALNAEAHKAVYIPKPFNSTPLWIVLFAAIGLPILVAVAIWVVGAIL